MAKCGVSLPGIVLFSTVSSCHYITRAKVCLLSVIQRPCGKAGSVSLCENLWGGQKLATRQPFSAVTGPKFTKFGACSRVAVY